MIAQLSLSFIKARPSKIWPRLVAYLFFEGRPLTTRGRWVNPLVFAMYRVWTVFPFRSPVTDPIYILGIGRSGTTILGTILALHKDVGFLNEPKALWHAALGDDDVVGSYSNSPGHIRMSEEEITHNKSIRLQVFYRAFLSVSGCHRIVDKYPELVFRCQFLTHVFPNSRKIALVRNGVDNCVSICRWSKFQGKATTTHIDDWWGRDLRKWRTLVEEVITPDPFYSSALPAILAFTNHTDMAAVEWIATMREILAQHAIDPENLFIVRYEDLVSNTHQTLTQILKFCDLDDDKNMLKFAVKELRTVQRAPDPELHTAIRPIFDKTMKELGYSTGKRQ